MERAGLEVLFAADNWPAAAQSYALNFTHPLLTVDLAEASGSQLLAASGVGPRPVDVVVGGPPCQGFSIQRIGDDQDIRNNLVLEFGRLVEEFAPRLFVMENVLGLLGRRGRELVNAFERQLAAAGYHSEAVTINAAEYGVPQIRRRVIYYGWRKDESSFRFPKPTRREPDFLTVWDAIGDLPSPPEDRTPHPDDPLHRRTRLSPLNQTRIEAIPPGGGMQNLPVELRVDCHKGGAERIGHRYVYGRLAPDRPASTITARFDSFTRGKFGHPVDPRNITLREGARLQTFPDDFRFEGTQEEIAAQIGNAVPPVLAEVIGTAIRKWLDGNHEAVGARRPVRSATGQLTFFDHEARP